MKEVYGSTWTLQLMIGFILLFVSFLTVTITYSKVFRLKNEVITIIEKYGGLNTNSIELINNYLKNSNYQITGTCEPKTEGVIKGITDITDSSESSLADVNENTRYYYCVEKEFESGRADNITTVNYEVTMFYRFNVPIIGDIATFTVKGKTADMINIPDLFS